MFTIVFPEVVGYYPGIAFCLCCTVSVVTLCSGVARNLRRGCVRSLSSSLPSPPLSLTSLPFPPSP